MADWNINVNAPGESGKPYVASIDTKDGTKVVVDSVIYPTTSTCKINCSRDSKGEFIFDVDLNEYLYDPLAEPRTVTVSVLLNGDEKGADSPTVQED